MLTKKDFQTYFEQIAEAKRNLRQAVISLKQGISDKETREILLSIEEKETQQFQHLKSILDKISND